MGGGEPEPGELPQLPPQAQQEMGVCGRGSGEGEGVRTMECGSEWAGPPTQHRATQKTQERGTRFSAPFNLSGFEGPWRALKPTLQRPYGETEALRIEDLPKVPNRGCLRGKQRAEWWERRKTERRFEKQGADRHTVTGESLIGPSLHQQTITNSDDV